jgi:hypothetical protein
MHMAADHGVLSDWDSLPAGNLLQATQFLLSALTNNFLPPSALLENLAVLRIQEEKCG